MGTLIRIKQKLSKTSSGRFAIIIYHHLIAKPLAKIYSYKYYFIKNKIKNIEFYSYEETFFMLENKKKSLCRFGDGEISWIYKDSKGYFNQDNSQELSDRLHEIILSQDDQILIGIPNFFGSLDHYSKKRKQSRNTHLAKYYKRWMGLVDDQRMYTDALISRVYHGLKDNKSKYMFEEWKKIWDGKSIVIVEGNQTRFGVGNDLLGNAKNVKRIIAPAENAFNKYDEILKASKEVLTKDVLFILSLGPTATVLAYDIGKNGGQAIDIGHLDIEYEWYLAAATKKTPVIGKYVNEAGGSSNVEMTREVLNKYRSEIVKIVE
ncbi:GT-D fold domain-containing glycosyltransferase [Rossellomorea marisflavi]|uniref:GT-D fold domain-containing glycosyltransferase n=1 Tax=Rossellomorea marisflavi TaxID=189381 RepID=UPI003D2EA5C3